MNELLIKIQLLLSSLPKSEKIIAEALLENPEAIEYMTLAQLSRESGASEAAIVRFSHHLGFDGYTAMKEGFIQSCKNTASLPEQDITQHEAMRTIMEKIYKNNMLTLSETLALVGDEYDQAVDALISAKAIHFFGTGDAYAVARLAYMKFKRLGIICSCDEDVMLQMITASNMSNQDVAIAVSYEGRSQNIVRAFKIAKQMGATTISITKIKKSPLMNYTDIMLQIAIHDLTIGRDKVTRRISDQFILDALYLGYTSRTRCNLKDQMLRTQIAIDGNKL